MNKARLLTAAVGMAAASAVLLTTVHGAEKPKYLFWTAAQMNDLDKKLLSSMDATKGSRVDMMPTDHSYFMVTHRESNSPSGEVHQKYGDFAVVRSGEGGILAGGKLVDSKQSAPNELRGKIEGGTLHRLKAGDVYYVPANVPHQTIVEPGKHLRVEMLKVERKDGFTDLPEFMSWDAALLLSTEKKLKTKLNKSFMANEDFIKNENTQFHLNHKEGSAESEIHDHLAEFQIIRNGEGSMMLGGKVVNAKNTGPGETRGTALEGAFEQPLRAGDLLYIPAGMPHHTIVDRTKSQDKLIVKVWVP
jgi:mannose-6-phosphate isomerase-like protein (cupin superfamily)